MSKDDHIYLDDACELLSLSNREIQKIASDNHISIGYTSEKHAFLKLVDFESIKSIAKSGLSSVELESLQIDVLDENPHTINDSWTDYESSDDSESEENSPIMNFSSEPERDRIVILGRRKAGKTVFMTRLYEQLWNSKDIDFHMKAVSGDSHKYFMHLAGQLREGNWIAATNETTYSDLELSHNGKNRLLVSVDYPGEVFTEAFVNGSDRKDAKELVNHVDKASAVIVLLSPDINIKTDVDESIDDTFGMQKAIEYIRNSPGGAEIPIALVVTKADAFKQEIRDAGGLKKFIKLNYLPILRVIGRYKPFVVAAVQTKLKRKSNGDASYIPSLDLPPVNLTEPIEWCCEKISSHEDEEERRLHDEQVIEEQHRILDDYNLRKKRSVMFWSVFWIIALMLGFLIVIATWSFMNVG